MKRTLALLIAVLMVVAILPLSALAATEQALPGASAPQVSVAPESQTSQSTSVAAYDAVDVSLGYLSEPIPGGSNNVDVEIVAQLWQGDSLEAAYADINDAFADLADGMRLELLYDVTISAVSTSNISWTLNGNGFAMYTIDGITVGGNSGMVEINDLTLYSEYTGIAIDCSSASSTAQITVTDVAVYAGASAFRVAKAGGKMIVEGNSFAETTGASTFYNAGKLEINDGAFYANNAIVCDLVGNSETVINGGMLVSTGECVARTASANGGAVLKVYGGILGLESDGASSPSYNAAVITNGNAAGYGHVYIYGGQFINANDGSILDAGASYSRQVLAQTNPNGNFQIFGGIMIATAVQDFFFTVADTQGAGIALPVADLAIVKGVTNKYVVGGRTFYYVAYGFGDTLVVPELQKDFDVNFPAQPDPDDIVVDLVLTAALDSVHYNTLLTWARVQAYTCNGQADDYSLAYGMVLTVPEALLATGGSLNAADYVGMPFMDYAASGSDVVLNANGLSFSLVLDGITPQDAELSLIAVPYIELTLDGGATTLRYFGEFNTNTDAISLASFANAALRDNYDLQNGTYRYPSITVSGVYNRYTVEQQEILQAFIPHDHVLDYKGECQVEDCEYSELINVFGDDYVQIFVESDSAHFFELELVKGATYVIEFTKNIVTYTLYNADGTVCATPNGVYTAAKDGTYYLRVAGKQSGNTYVVISHVHDANFKGECGVCCAEGDSLSLEVAVDEVAYDYFAKNNYYYYNVALEADVSYTVSCVNGLVRLYNASGKEMSFKKGVFECTEAGTYYVVVEAIHSGTAAIVVNHVHAFDYKGVCTVEGCEVDVCVALENVYAYMAPKPVVAGSKLYFSINLVEGESYSVKTNRYFGTFKVYDADGVEIELENDVFTCDTTGLCYLVFTVDANVNNAKLSVAVEHVCSWNYKGECKLEHPNANGDIEIVSCGETALTRMFDCDIQDLMMEPGRNYSYSFNYASAELPYVIDLPKEGVTYKLYDQYGVELETTPADNANDPTRIADVYVGDEARMLYLLVTCTAQEELPVQFSFSHVHEIGHKGSCIITDTTRNQPCMYTEAVHLDLDSEIAVNFVSGNTYRYEVTLEAGWACKITLSGGTATWVVRAASGKPLLTNDNDSDNTFVVAMTDTYYLTVVATADSAAGATLKAEFVSDFDGEPAPDSPMKGDYIKEPKHVAYLIYEGTAYYYDEMDTAVVDALANGVTEIVVLKSTTMLGENAKKYINGGKSLTVKGADESVLLTLPLRGFQVYHGSLTFKDIKLDLTGDSIVYYGQGAVYLTFENVELAASNWCIETGDANQNVNIAFINSKIVHKAPVINGSSSAYVFYFSASTVNFTINGLETNARLVKSSGTVLINVDVADLVVTSEADCAFPAAMTGLTVRVVAFGNDKTAVEYGYKFRLGATVGGKIGEVYFTNSVEAFAAAENAKDPTVWDVSGETPVEVEKCSHVEVTIPGSDPTCTETGLTAGTMCEKCQEVFTEQKVIPALGHKDAEEDAVCDVCEGVIVPNVTGDTEKNANHAAAIVYGPYTFYYTDFAVAVQEALSNNLSQIVLFKDATVSSRIVIPYGKKLIIKGADGADATLTVATTQGIEAYGDITLENLTFVTEKLDPAVKYFDGCAATFIDVTIKPKQSYPLSSQTNGSNTFKFVNCTIDFDGTPTDATYLIYFAGTGTLTVVAEGLATEISVAKLTSSNSTINLNLTGVTKIGSTMGNFYLGNPKKGEFIFGDSASDDMVA